MELSLAELMCRRCAYVLCPALISAVIRCCLQTNWRYYISQLYKPFQAKVRFKCWF